MRLQTSNNIARHRVGSIKMKNQLIKNIKILMEDKKRKLKETKVKKKSL